MRHIFYQAIARIFCFVCHGRCCKYTMCFKIIARAEKKKKIVFKKFDKTQRCARWNPNTGKCHEYENRLRLCKQWKCISLNWLSRLCDEPLWEGVFYD